MEIDVLEEDPRWRALGLHRLCKTAVSAVLSHLGIPPDSSVISVLACDDSRIAELNAAFRGKTRPTNVLSWPAEDLAAAVPGGQPACPAADADGTFELGDIALAFDTCTREAALAGKPVTDHVTHLVVHATLHLLGYDHEEDPDAALMEGLEREILGKMGIDDPYMD